MIFGIDVSHEQKGKVDYPAVAAADKKFAFIKASEGLTYRDDATAVHIKGFRDAKIQCVGIYHFIHVNKDPVQQAQLVTSIAKDQGISVIAVDFERTDGFPVGQSFATTLQCLDEIKSITGLLPIVYGLANFWPSWPSPFAEYDLWIEHYAPINSGTIVNPKAPPPWSQWLFHQYAADALPGIAPGSCPGVIGNVDLNRFDGEEEDLIAYFGAYE